MIKKLKLMSGSTIAANLDAIAKISPSGKIRRDKISSDEIIITHDEKPEKEFSSYLEEETEKIFEETLRQKNENKLNNLATEEIENLLKWK